MADSGLHGNAAIFFLWREAQKNRTQYDLASYPSFLIPNS